jgi:hypothetical protein
MRAGFERPFGLYLLGSWNVFRGQKQGEETTVRITYLTRDEVNQHAALTFAGEHDVRLDVQARPEEIGQQECDAVLFDPDSFPREERRANLAAVLACPNGRPLAVHSFDLPADQRHALRGREAIVARRLQAGLFARLVTAVHAVQRQKTVA